MPPPRTQKPWPSRGPSPRAGSGDSPGARCLLMGTGPVQNRILPHGGRVAAAAAGRG